MNLQQPALYGQAAFVLEAHLMIRNIYYVKMILVITVTILQRVKNCENKCN